jgi:hypothetical protein
MMVGVRSACVGIRMADNTLPREGISRTDGGQPSADRRAFLRRAAVTGLPVVLATVAGRSVMAQDTSENGSGCGSIHPSGWLRRGNVENRARACESFENLEQVDQFGVEPITEPVTEPLSEPTYLAEPTAEPTSEPTFSEPTGAKGWGKGGRPK